jgi:sugar diacid utilization regulator
MASAGKPIREQVAALRRVLEVSALLTEQDDRAEILKTVASAVASIAGCEVVGVLLGKLWQKIGGGGVGLQPAQLAQACGQPGGGRVALAGACWAWAYPIPAMAGFLVVSAAAEAAESDSFLLHALALHAGVALANADLLDRERAQVAQLRSANLALRRSMEIYDVLTQVALRGDGQEGIARAIYELTGHPAGIEDTFGNLITWAGPGPQDSRPRATPAGRVALLARAMAASGPVRDDDRLISAARVAGDPVAVLVLADPGQTAGEAERVAIEHATTVLAMEVASLQNLEESAARARGTLVLHLVAGADEQTVVSQALALGYDLGRPHRVVVLKREPGSCDDIQVVFHAARKAVQTLRVGSLMASRLSDVILLADAEVPWQRFHACVEAQAPGLRCSIGVGGWCEAIGDYPRSHREAGLALRIQRAVGSTEQVTVFNDLGVYQVLATEDDTSSMEAFVQDWLGALLDYDAVHGAQLVRTLADFLECGGSYDAAATALAVHRSTLKYRLKRIREVSGHDLGVPDTQFNLQIATRAWRTLQALRTP